MCCGISYIDVIMAWVTFPPGFSEASRGFRVRRRDTRPPHLGCTLQILKTEGNMLCGIELHAGDSPGGATISCGGCAILPQSIVFLHVAGKIPAEVWDPPPRGEASGLFLKF